MSFFVGKSKFWVPFVVGSTVELHTNGYYFAFCGFRNADSGNAVINR
jgi:hypothetical protein